jgi:hypothetical protein
MILKSLDAMGKNYILIGQDKISKQKDVSTGVDYEKHTLTLHEKSAKLVFSNVDAALYCQWETAVNQEKGIIKNTGERIMLTMDSGVAYAKNRYGLQPVEPMTKGSLDKIFNCNKKPTPTHEKEIIK